MSKAGTDALNKYLQGIGNPYALSWKESCQTGPESSKVWTIVCMIDGKELGRASGSRKHIAKDNAANQALASLGAGGN